VIDSFKRCVCCALLLILPLVLLPIASCAAADVQVGGAESPSVPAKDSDLPESSVQASPPLQVEAAQQIVAIATMNPTVTTSIVDTALSDAASSSQVTFTFAGAPTNFTAVDITAVGGTLSDLVQYLVGDGTGKIYSATFTADDNFDGTGSVTVGTGWQDAAGNTGVGGSDTVVIDTENPAVTEVTANHLLITDAAAGPGMFALTVTFSEAMDTASAPLLTFGSDISASLTFASASWDGTGTIYSATYDVIDVNVDVTDIPVVVTGTQDAHGNMQQSYAALPELSIDTANPTVAVNFAETTINSIANSSQLTFTFSESSNNFTTADLTVVGGTVSGLAPQLHGNTTGKVYTAIFTAEAGFTGTAAVTVGTDWQDAVGNTGVGSSDTVVVVAASEERGLASLIGQSEISVFADVDGRFVKSLTENQLLQGDLARPAAESDLQESIRAGRSFNRDSLAILARTEQAKAQTGQAFALLLPSVFVRYSRGYETSEPSVQVDETTGELLASDTHMRTDASLNVRQPLFDLPSYFDWRRRRVIEQARGESYRGSDGDAYVSVVNAYLSLVSTRVQAEITRAFETQLADLLSYIEKRASAGAASVSDMTRVRARREATLSSRLEQESAAAAAGVEFVRLTNLVPQTIRLPVIEDVGAASLPESFDRAVAAAMTANPEIAALTAEVEAADIDKLAAKSRFVPRVDAEFSDTYSLHAGGDPSPDGQRDKRAMMVLNWSLFNGGGDYQYHVERSARQKELQYRLDDQRRRVIQTLSANYALLATTNERITSGYKELESITTAADAMSKRMLSGNQSLLDLLDVYDRFYQARSRLVALHILEMSTVAQLVRVAHGTPDAVSAEPPMAQNAPAALENTNSLKEDK